MASKVTASDTKTMINRRRPGFTDLPRELRDQIYSLVIGDQDPMLWMTSRPCEAYRNLIQVSKAMRAEAANVYWSSPQRRFSFFTIVSRNSMDLISPKDKSTVRSLGLKCPGVYGCESDLSVCDELEAWYKIYGHLGVDRIRKLDIIFPSNILCVKIDLAQPLVQIDWHEPERDWGIDEQVKAFILAVLLPGGQRRVTCERFLMLCSILNVVWHANNWFVTGLHEQCASRREAMRGQLDAEIDELLSIEAYTFHDE